ncbi:MAG: 2-isopropylmalate synthase [Deltaproteobacteria bacterium]|nr:2-isopropylmalate synthase [Deltaproteobacteria bacterium]MBW2446464.1 2-isopropylmalate synthase [Deltaproteobacteria bacterium]
MSGNHVAATRRVVVFDTTLRDGEQSAGVAFSARDKVEIARALADLRVDVVEAGFPGASLAEVEAVRAVAREVRDVVVCGLARAVAADVEAAGEALHEAARSRIHIFVNSSDMHLAHQLGKGREQVVRLATENVRRARHVTPDVEFSPMDATRADWDFLTELVTAAVEAGATTINVPDTVGCARPTTIAALFRHLHATVPGADGVTFSFHGQDDLGLATANALAAVEAGAGQVEVAVNGIGERAGNTSLEEVVLALRVHGSEIGVHTSVDPRGICPLSRLVEQRSGIPVPPNKAVVGANAFRHASGIHQDGVLKFRETYELIDPEEIGHPVGTEIVLGKLSGRAGFRERARQLGFALEGELFEAAFQRFQAQADRQPVVEDADLRKICRPVAAA